MDHKTAIGTRAAERYALDEMEPEEESTFEAHFFECPTCAANVKAATGFRTNARSWFQQHCNSELREEPEREKGWGWWRLGWLSPAFTALFAVLTGYAWLVTIPSLRTAKDMRETIEAYQPVVLRSQMRGEALPVVEAAPGKPAVLSLNIESEREFRGYEIEVQNASGAIISRTNVPAWLTVTLKLPASLLGNGTHTVIVRGADNGRPEVGKYQFDVRIR